MTAEQVKQCLALQPHPREGGWFVETYRTAATLPAAAYAGMDEPQLYDGPRRLTTAIYYLLEAGTFSEMHRLQSDEIFHHYGGCAVEMLQLGPDGRQQRIVIGPALLKGERPQVLVPKGVWQGSRLLPGQDGKDDWALLGCTVSPGFEYADYESGSRSALLRLYPGSEDLIRALTHKEATA